MSEYPLPDDTAATVKTGVLTSILRTFVPMLVGLIVTAGLRLGVDLGEDPETIAAITGAITVLIGTIYYAVVRELETRVGPAWGWLLGRANAPQYIEKG